MAENKNRLQALDALSGLAAMFLVLFHFMPYYNELYGHNFISSHFLEYGRSAMAFIYFFILSGFVNFYDLKTHAKCWKIYH